MQIIPLTRNKFTIVDDEDYDSLMQWKWQFDGRYAVRSAQISYINKVQKCKTLLMHRVIMKAENGMDVDHINMDGRIDGLNNQKYNLRIATRQQNLWNSRKSANCSSVYKGVCWHKGTKKWVAFLRKDGKQIYLGLYKTEIQAALVYNASAKEHYGEFARLNLV